MPSHLVSPPPSSPPSLKCIAPVATASALSPLSPSHHQLVCGLKLHLRQPGLGWMWMRAGSTYTHSWVKLPAVLGSIMSSGMFDWACRAHSLRNPCWIHPNNFCSPFTASCLRHYRHAAIDCSSHRHLSSLLAFRWPSSLRRQALERIQPRFTVSFDLLFDTNTELHALDLAALFGIGLHLVRRIDHSSFKWRAGLII